MLEIDNDIFESLLKKGEKRFDSILGNKTNKSGDKRGGPGGTKPTSGRQDGDTAIPPVIKEVIARTALVDTGKNVSKTFDVADSTVNRLKNHEINTDEYVKQAQHQAAEKLLMTLGVIRAEEIECSPLKDKVLVADKLASVINKLGTRNTPDIVQQVIMYQPEPKKIEDFEIIDV